MTGSIRKFTRALTIAYLLITATQASADEPKGGFAFDVKAGEAKFQGARRQRRRPTFPARNARIERYDANWDARITREEFLGGLSTEQMRAGRRERRGGRRGGGESSIVVPSDNQAV